MGEVIVAGECINALSDRQRTLLRRRSIGIVFQSFNLISSLDVLDNVALPVELARMPRNRSVELARHWLNEVGLADRAASAVHDLSGGEQQRVALARALIHEPQVILADEPTGNLDRENSYRVLELFQRLVVDGSRTLIMATHSEEAAQVGQRRYRVSANGLDLVRT